ncbi:Hypothetical predicted protein [Mytilus galloprovincialis]|uniref:B box-type domain-containing protein n=1 Tax=Mytilus galloprovincialis TaxID=29158 RepID=A0A8B6FTK0_MYTGA|nr:Hypothetical predicted protein [Mytilus galloprovincialis]
MEGEILPKICEFCEASPEIKMNCINCNLFLCRACHLKIHSKIKSANDHIGIEIQEYHAESISENSRKVILKQMLCVKHNQKTCFMFCRDCEQLICSTCVIESHQQHTFEEIDHAYDEKEKELRSLTVQLDSEIGTVETHAARLLEMKSEGEKNVLEVKSKILQHEDQIKENISMEAKTLLTQVDNRWEVTKDSITKQRKRVQKRIVDLEKRKAQLNLILHSRQASEIFVTAKEMKRLLPNTCLSNVQIETLRFTPSEIDLENIGVCHKQERYEHVCNFQTNLNDVSKMLEIEENQYVLYSSVENKVQQVQFINKTINVQLEVDDVEASDIAVTKDRHTLLLIESYVYCLTDNCELIQLTLGMACEDLRYVQCINVNNENQIVVGSIFENPPYDEEPYSGIVAVFAPIVHFNDQTYEEVDEEPLFSKNFDNSIPQKIISTVNNDYCLIVTLTDSLHDTKLITRYNHEFEFTWQYNGCCKDKFSPVDVTESPSELICVADNFNSAIHVLNQDGDVLTCNLLVTEVVANPLSIYINSNGLLFITCEKTNEHQPPHIYLFKLK